MKNVSNKKNVSNDIFYLIAYTSLKLMQAIINKVNEICTRYLDNSRLALLPPPPSTPLPQITAGGSKNCRRKMEDRYVILHDLHTTFGIEVNTDIRYLITNTIQIMNFFIKKIYFKLG